jgi:hypothetical protein
LTAIFNHAVIDVHFYPLTKEVESMSKFQIQAESYLHNRQVSKEQLLAESLTVDELAEEYRKHHVVAMPAAWDAETATADPVISNDYVAGLVKKYPDVFIAGWAMVDPWKGRMALDEIERSIKELKLIGVKFNQSVQKFRVNDPYFVSVWKLCQQLKVPVLLHGGTTVLGAGAAGGMGVHLDYARPIPDIDDLAAEFPELRIVVVGVGHPWTAQFTALTRHKTNIYRVCSGMWPSEYPEEMMYELNRRLTDKYMMASDYPFFPLRELLEQHAQVDYRIKGDLNMRENVLYKNALEIFAEDFARVGADLGKFQA